MNINLTAVFKKSPYAYIGYVEELPGVNTHPGHQEIDENLTRKICKDLGFAQKQLDIFRVQIVQI